MKIVIYQTIMIFNSIIFATFHAHDNGIENIPASNICLPVAFNELGKHRISILL